MQRLFGLTILVLMAALSGGCSDSKTGAPPANRAHPADWLALHSSDPAAAGLANSCRVCHGANFEGSGKAVSCFNCHSSGPPFALHPSWWNGDALREHRHFHNEGDPARRMSWTTCAVALCHGPELKGGGNGPSCFSTDYTGPGGVANNCHAAGPPVPAAHATATAYRLPENHGYDAKDAGNLNLSMGNYCLNCHGRPTNQFDGGYVSAPNIINNPLGLCSTCHPDATAHPTDWVRADNPIYFHSTVSPETISGSCALCHKTTAPGTSPVPNAPSCFSTTFQNANATTANCHASGPGGAGHALPFQDPALHGLAAKADLTFCQTCHATAGGAGTNPQFNVPVGDLVAGCESMNCHAAGTAHPAGEDRWTFQLDPTGIRRTHFAAGNTLTACKLCHDVEVGDTGGAAPACTGCHVSAPQFALKCDACHGVAPGPADPLPGALPVDHGAVPLASHDECIRCHGSKDDGTGNLVAGASSYQLFDRLDPALAEGGDHLDGYIEMNGPAPSTGAGYNQETFTCENAGCHGSGGLFVLSDSTLPVEFGNYGNATAAGCTTCHGYPPDGTADASGATTPVDHTGVTNLAAFLSAHNGCVLCHGDKDDGTGNHYDATYHQDGNIQMNLATGYDETLFGCTASCHGALSPTMSDSGLPVVLVDFGGGGTGSCDSCHTSGFGGAPIVIAGTTAHTSNLTCENCHTDHNAGTLVIPNNTAVGINYGADHGNGISLGGSATSGQTEAEICWNCHAGGGVDGEWGLNTDTNETATNYDFGNIYTNAALTTKTQNWVGATWTSGTAKFGYKTGPIQSIHTANPQALGGPASNTGDTVGQIRCSYCHDVHNLNLATGDSFIGAPYLRGTWMGNPYREDGAPQAGDTWTVSGRFGLVPRGGIQSTQLGGYQIDQNNADPTAGWTLASSAGLCILCHGTDVNNMNQFGTASNDWVGTNGHSNAVIGGTGSNAANIFSTTDRNSTPPTFSTSYGTAAGNPAMAYQQVSSGTYARAYGFRSGSSYPDGWNLTPRITSTYAHDDYNWGADTNNALDAGYHKFSCSKCHNPHASRLPRLMITNCLDTKHNTWDDGQSSIPSVTTANNDGGATPSTNNALAKFSNSTSAQNCHRVKDPAFPNARGAGWNNVTPW